MNIIYTNVYGFHVSFLFSTAIVVSLNYVSELYMIFDFTQSPLNANLHSHAIQRSLAKQKKKRTSATTFSNGKILLKKQLQLLSQIVNQYYCIKSSVARY